MYIVALNGSPNKSGNCQFLIDTILEDCKANGAVTETINAHSVIMTAKWPYCADCKPKCEGKCYAGTALETAFEKLAKADAIIIASPVYFGNVTSQLKAFWDKMRLYRGKKTFIGKPVGFISCGASRFGGQEETIRAMQTMALIQGMTVVNSGDSEFDCGHLGVSAQSPSIDDQFAITRCHSMANRLLTEIKDR